MALPEIDYKTVTLSNGKSFTVRGLSLPDVSGLIATHSDAIQGFFAKFMADRTKGTSLSATLSMEAVGTKLLMVAPEIAARIIAYASDDPEHVERAAKLPMGVQMDALEKIAELTFEAEGGPKKFGEAVIRLLQGTTNLMMDLNLSSIGSLASDAK